MASWARFTAVLPVVALGSFVFLSDSGELARTPPLQAAQGTDSDLPHVVFLLLDEFPTRSLLDTDGDLDAARYPNLAALTDDAVWYRGFTAMAPFTNAAVPNLLTGTEPKAADPLWTEHPDSLFTLLEPTHILRANESVTALCGSPACIDGRDHQGGPPGAARQLGAGADQAMDILISRVDPAQSQPEGLEAGTENVGRWIDDEPGPFSRDFTQSLPLRFQDFVETMTDDRPTLHFLHLMLPHWPWRLYEDGSEYVEPMTGAGDLLVSSMNGHDWISAANKQRHLLQATYTDRLIGELVDTMRHEGIYDESILVIVGDHGASFNEGTDLRVATVETLDSIAYTPLFIKPPTTGAGGVDDSNLMTIDVVPTLADLLGLEVPWDTTGHPAGSEHVAARGSEKRFALMTNPFNPVITEVVAFDDDEHRPRNEDRLIVDVTDGDLFGPLWDLAGAAAYRGADIDDIVTGDGGVASVNMLGRLERPREGSVPLGVVGGATAEAHGAGDDAIALIAVDGTVVAASPVFDLDDKENQFVAVLPSGTILPGEPHEIDVVVVDGDEALLMETRPT